LRGLNVPRENFRAIATASSTTWWTPAQSIARETHGLGLATKQKDI
jgi:hypothetical protein